MMEVTWLGHSTFELRFENGEVLVTDPWVEGNPKHPKDFKFEKIDTIIVSHGHFDHFHDAVSLAKKFKAKAVGIFEVATYMESNGVKETVPMNKGGSVKVNSVTLTMTHALHSSCIVDGSKMQCAGEPAGFVLHIPDGRKVYFAGDTSIFSEMTYIQQLYQPEIAFLPIGDLFTMGPKEAALACSLLKPKQVIPMHYGTFPALTGTPEEFAKELAGAAELVVLEPGKKRVF